MARGSPADTVCRVQLTVVDHPLARARLTRMRDERTDNAMFRAALGMADTAHGMLPESQMGFVGLARNEVTFQPEAYMASLPESLVDSDVFVLDPMLATGGSLVHCCGLLTPRGPTWTPVPSALAPRGVYRWREQGGLPSCLSAAS